VLSVKNSAGKTIEDYPDKCSQLLRTDVADAVNDILKGVQEPGGFGYDNGLGLSQQSAGKTGTTSFNQAVWFDGYTPNLSTVAMIAGANSKGHPLSLNGQTIGGVYIQGAHGSTTAGPMWGDAMKVVEQWLPDETFDQPSAQAIDGQLVTVPSVYGENTQTAASTLQQAGFTPVIGSTVDSSYSAGTVAYLSPGSGEQASTGSTVTIYVSDGSPYVAPQPAPQPAPQAQANPAPQNNNKGNKNGNGNGRRGRR
jgi:membrane peptidoglycan carboxypeptidase